MNTDYYSGFTVNRCRPGYGASCSLCCGSHNYTIPPGQIEEMFLERGSELTAGGHLHPETATAEKLIQDAMQCSHVGIRSESPGEVCCLVYDDYQRGNEVESFVEGTCRSFYCPAWDNLTDRQVLFAARLMGDWYYYSLFINHIEAVQEISAEYTKPEDVPDDVLVSLKEELVERFLEEDGK
jgi:hypothetical protein